MQPTPSRQRSSASRRAGLALCLGACLAFPLGALAGGDAAPPRPFEATYRLAIEGWPDTDVIHRLRPEGDAWVSEMRARIAVASGWERSRFSLEGERVTSRDYASGYSLFGLGKNYRLTAGELGVRPDRQAALFALSRQAAAAPCWHSQVAPCTLTYTDYEGEEQRLHYRRLETTTLELPAGRFPAVTLALWRGEHPDRDLRLTFSPRLPGLLLSADYFKDGEHKSRMRLSRLHVNDLALAD